MLVRIGHLPSLLALLILPQGLSASPAQLTTVAEYQAARTNSVRTHYEYRLTGTIRNSWHRDRFILKDDSGSTSFRQKDLKLPPNDTIVTVEGAFNSPVSKADITRVLKITVVRPGPRCPPRDVSAADIVDAPPYNNEFVRLEGTVVNVIPDDISPEYVFLLLQDGSASVLITIRESELPLSDASKLLNARVRAQGIHVTYVQGHRTFNTSTLLVDDRADIEVLRPPPEDFDYPELDYQEHLTPEAAVRLGRRTTVGTVLAAWQDRQCLVSLRGGSLVRVCLEHGESLPPVGHDARVVGNVTTDLFHLMLTHAKATPLSAPPEAIARKPRRTDLRDLFHRRGARPSVNPELFGRLLSLRGAVCDLPTEQTDVGILRLRDNEGFSIDVDASSCPKAIEGISVGCTAEATGIFVFEAEPWHPDAPFPTIARCRLVLRTPADLAVVSRPFLVSPQAFTWITGGLLLVLVAIFIWNRVLHHLVELRSRQLLREQSAHTDSELRIGERTRLAVELHDTLSQNLVGVACQIAAVQDVIRSDAETASARLATAERTLDSCRTGLRQVLTDLRSDALDAKDFTTALETVLEPVKGGAGVAIRFNVPRHRFHDSTAHAILCIIRELVGNAVRHGQATDIRIAGSLDSDLLRFSVRENGCGFDPARRPGTSQGHFGLEGVRNRVKRLRGNFRIDSSPGKGSYASVSIPLPKHAEPHS